MHQIKKGVDVEVQARSDSEIDNYIEDVDLLIACTIRVKFSQPLLRDQLRRKY